MHQPADVGSQLLRFRSGQQHAEIERVQETPLGNPAPPLHQFLVHQRNLSGRAAKTDETELQPEQ